MVSEFFGRTLKDTWIRAELDDLGLADLGVQVVTCQRMKPDLVEGILESLCNGWRETLGRRQTRVCCLFNEMKRRRNAGATGSSWQG